MFSIELTINIVALFALMTASALAGFALKRWHVSKIRTRLARVEYEVIRSHKEILELQKECMTAERQLSGTRNEAISIRSAFQNKCEKKLPNTADRKKLLRNL